jgi:hypothetical protein
MERGFLKLVLMVVVHVVMRPIHTSPFSPIHPKSPTQQLHIKNTAVNRETRFCTQLL